MQSTVGSIAPIIVHSDFTASALQEHFHTVYRELTDPAVVGLKFGQLFGVRNMSICNISSTRSLLFGSKRQCDGSLLDKLTERLDRGETLACLEVGAGQTYWGDGDGCGSPWFSRALAAAFPGRVNILASDVLGDYQSYSEYHEISVDIIYIDSGYPPSIGVMTARLDPQSELFRDIPISELDRSTGMLRPIPLDFVEQVMIGWGIVPYELYMQLQRTSGRKVAESGRVFIRPTLDREVERFLFGLHVVCGVNFNALKSRFPDSMFDIVFSRNLHPSDADGFTLDSAEDVLNELGLVYLNVDDKTLIGMEG